jgi:hypothetical protein
MAEPAKARTETPPATDPITIVLNATGYVISPETSDVANNGTVQFSPNESAWVYTYYDGELVSGVFGGQTTTYVQCTPGGTSNNYTPATAYYDSEVNISAAKAGSPPPSMHDPAASIKGTISIGSVGIKRKERK